MKINLQDNNPGTWFYFNPEKREEGGVSLRVLTPSVLEKFRKQFVTKKYEFAKPVNDIKGSKAQRFEWEEVDDEKYDLAKWDYCIVDWENLTDENDVPIPCTAENKSKLMGEQMGFMTFVIVSLKQLNEERLEKLKDKEKN